MMLHLRLSLCALALIIVPVLSSGTDYGITSKSSKSVGKATPMPASEPTLPPTPLPDCSFTDRKEAASFGNIVVATFWNDVLKTDCSENELSELYDNYFDEAIVVTVEGFVIATNLTELKASPFSQVIISDCETPDRYVSWLTLNAEINNVENGVVTLVTNEIYSVPKGVCGYGYSYTFKVKGEKCDDVVVTAITGNGTLTLTGLNKCQQ